jgi:hypothetical protein
MKQDNESKAIADHNQTNHLIIDRGFPSGYQHDFSKAEDDAKLSNSVINAVPNSKISWYLLPITSTVGYFVFVKTLENKILVPITVTFGELVKEPLPICMPKQLIRLIPRIIKTGCFGASLITLGLNAYWGTGIAISRYFRGNLLYVVGLVGHNLLKVLKKI